MYYPNFVFIDKTNDFNILSSCKNFFIAFLNLDISRIPLVLNKSSIFLIFIDIETLLKYVAT